MENSTVSVTAVQLPWREQILFHTSLSTRANKSGGPRSSPVDGNDEPRPWAHFRKVRPPVYESRTRVLREKKKRFLPPPLVTIPNSSLIYNTIWQKRDIIIISIISNKIILFYVLTRHHPTTTKLWPRGGGVSALVRGPR